MTKISERIAVEARARADAAKAAAEAKAPLVPGDTGPGDPSVRAATAGATTVVDTTIGDAAEPAVGTDPVAPAGPHDDPSVDGDATRATVRSWWARRRSVKADRIAVVAVTEGEAAGEAAVPPVAASRAAGGRGDTGRAPDKADTNHNGTAKTNATANGTANATARTNDTADGDGQGPATAETNGTGHGPATANATTNGNGAGPATARTNGTANGNGHAPVLGNGHVLGRDRPGATVVLEAPRHRGAPPTVIAEREPVVAVASPAREASRVGPVALVVSAGVLLDALAYALGWTGHVDPVLPLFFVGLLVIFAPCAWRLTAAHARRRERVQVSLLLGVGLLLSEVLRSPFLFDQFDEMLHGATLNQLLNDHSLHVPNTVLPISPYFPGLELFTIAVKWVTGLPLLLSQDVVLLVARVLLVLGVFLVVEKLCGSARAGGLGVLVYAANPQFYSFDGQYAYETLALALAVGAVYLFIAATQEAQRWAATSESRGARRIQAYHRDPSTLLSVIHPAYLRVFPASLSSTGTVGLTSGPGPETDMDDASRRSLARRFALNFVMALVCVAALAVTHHLTSWLTVAFLVVVAIGLRSSGRSVAAGVVGGAAFTAAVVVGLWTAFVGTRLWAYLGPIFHGAWSGVANAVGHLHATRQLFTTGAGASSAPPWEIVVMLAAAVIWCAVLVPASWSAIRNGTVRGGPLCWIVVLVAGAYPLTLLAHLSTASAEVGVRSTAFLFFGVAVVVAGWLAVRLGAFTRRRWRAALVGVSLVCFLGTMLLGSGPDWLLVPGKYLVTADQRSVDAPSLAAADWATTHIAPGTHVAADRVNGVLMADTARIEPVTAIGGMVNAGPLFFSRTVGPYQKSLIRKAQIRYIVVDDRLTRGLPLLSAYIEPGDTAKPTRLTSEELHKFASVPGIRLVYDNGPIQVYDLSGILGTPAPAAPSAPLPDRGGPDVVVMVAAAAVSVLVLVRLHLRRRDRGAVGVGALRWLVGSVVAGVVLATAFVPTHVDPSAVGLGALAVVAAIAVIATRRPSAAETVEVAARPGAAPSSAPPSLRWSRWSTATAVVTVALLAGGVLLATVSARSEGRAPDQVTLSTGASGRTVATVELAKATPGDRLVVTAVTGAQFSASLQATTDAQTVTLPPSASTASTARIVSAG